MMAAARTPHCSAEPFEKLRRLQGLAMGLEGYIAIHSLARGPAFGGCRLRAYASDEEARADAMRLAEGMTYKNALAELPFGGGKAVLIATPLIHDRKELFRAFGRAVAELHGKYITAEDVGTTPADMELVREETPYVSGIARPDRFGGDPARFTALGLFLSIQAAVRRVLRRESLRAVTVAIQGAGAVGSHLCAELARAGADVWLSDVDAARAQALAQRWDAQVVSADRILERRVHVLAPCALGGVLDGESIERIKAPIVAGAANNQLATPECGDRLHERGILYLPDFLVNAGGIIAVAHEYLGAVEELEVLEKVARIGDRAERLIEETRRTHVPPARIALDWARANL